ncbi:MAG: exonuclease domain-containing protein [Chitinophagaceae bacterium]
MYAIVDIETTGTYSAANDITEISIQVFDGQKVVEKFETLINPCQSIPRYIQAMTGITDEMVAEAPTFEEVSESVYDILKDKVFVAHSVNFDYSFIKGNLAAHGFDLNCKKLCTVRLSRKIIPGKPSYSLGNLCDSLGIYNDSRHRAGGDAFATVKLFKLLLENDKEDFIAKSLKKDSKEQVLPPNVPKSDFDKLPYTPGVYYFHNEKGKIVYVGKAKNIRYRVNSHFSNNSESRQKQNFMRHVYSISYESCGTELMACILESTEIKRLWPVFNQSQKRWEDVYGIFSFEDQNGYKRLAIEKNKRYLTPVYTFHYLIDGHAILRKLIDDFNLCPKLCFMQTNDEPCTGSNIESCKGACEQKESSKKYNARVDKAIDSLHHQPTYVITDKGIGGDDQSCILVENGKLYGMGYLPEHVQISDITLLKDYIKPLKENSFIRNMLAGYVSKDTTKVKFFSQEFIQPTENLQNEAFL